MISIATAAKLERGTYQGCFKTTLGTYDFSFRMVSVENGVLEVWRG
jgi:hypothetical protein